MIRQESRPMQIWRFSRSLQKFGRILTHRRYDWSCAIGNRVAFTRIREQTKILGMSRYLIADARCKRCAFVTELSNDTRGARWTIHAASRGSWMTRADRLPVRLHRFRRIRQIRRIEKSNPTSRGRLVSTHAMTRRRFLREMRTDGRGTFAP